MSPESYVSLCQVVTFEQENGCDLCFLCLFLSLVSSTRFLPCQCYQHVLLPLVATWGFGIALPVGGFPTSYPAGSCRAAVVPLVVIGLLVAGGEIVGSTAVAAAVVVAVAAVVFPISGVDLATWRSQLCRRLASVVVGQLSVGGEVGGRPEDVWRALHVLYRPSLTQGELVFPG